MKYTAQYFIDKFSRIPEQFWFVGDYWNPENKAQKCALGHCGHYQDRAEGIALVELFKHSPSSIGHINDGLDERYQQTTHKQRVLAALRDLQPQALRIVYVAVSPEVTKSMECQLN